MYISTGDFIRRRTKNSKSVSVPDMAFSHKAAPLVFLTAPLWTQQNHSGEKVISSPFPLLTTGGLPHNPAFILPRNDVCVANIGRIAHTL